MISRIPYEIREALISVCGKAFWYRDPFRAFLLSCGVPAGIYDRYGDESKFKIARHILAELDSLGDDGFDIQRRIITELARMRRPPDENVPNREAALEALRWLKKLAVNQRIVVETDQKTSDARAEEAKRKQAGLAARAQKLNELRTTFYGWTAAKDDPQARGYGLEDLLSELFELHEITYRRPYKTSTEQIDGHFTFKGFDYLVEARWRLEQPKEGDLAILKSKADKKLTSTRGLFVSMPGYRPEVVVEFTRGVTSNIVLMDGQDLVLILEGQISLMDALDLKIRKAAQEGIIYFPLSQRFSTS